MLHTAVIQYYKVYMIEECYHKAYNSTSSDYLAISHGLVNKHNYN